MIGGQRSASDSSLCAACGGRLRTIAALTDPASIRPYLNGVGLPARPPALGPSEGTAATASAPETWKMGSACFQPAPVHRGFTSHASYFVVDAPPRRDLRRGLVTALIPAWPRFETKHPLRFFCADDTCVACKLSTNFDASPEILLDQLNCRFTEPGGRLSE